MDDKAQISRRRDRMTGFTIVTALGAVVLLALGGGLPAQGEPILLEGIAAQVGEEIILESEIFEQVAVARMQYAVPDSSLANLREEIMERMIDEKIIIQEARSQGITTTAEEVDRAVDQYISTIKQNLGSDEALDRELAKEGLTYEGLLERYRNEAQQEILYSRLVQREIYAKIEVTDEEVEEYYKEHRHELPEKAAQLRLSHVFAGIRPADEAIAVAQAKLEAVGQRLEGGEEFGAIARELSDDPGTRELGGDLGWFSRGQLGAQFEEVAFALKPGEVSEPFQTSYGVELVRLIEKDEEADRVHAQHILILLRATQEDLERAEETADRVLRLARTGVDFTTLAAEYSDDQNSADKGGDLGHFKQSELMPFVAKGIEGLGVGEISDVVRTDQGFHVFKVMERQVEGAYTLAELHEQLRTSIGEQRAATLTKEWLDGIRSNYFIRRTDSSPLDLKGLPAVGRRGATVTIPASTSSAAADTAASAAASAAADTAASAAASAAASDTTSAAASDTTTAAASDTTAAAADTARGGAQQQERQGEP